MAIKQFMLEREGDVDAYVRELAAYTRIAATRLPGSVTPRLLRTGMFARTGALFLALSYEGDSLAACMGRRGGLTEELRAEVKDAGRALHG